MTTENGHTAHAGLLAAAGPPIEHRGRTYRCQPLHQDNKAELERRLMAQAMRAAALAPPEVREDALAAVAASAAGGAYGFYGKASERALNSPAGMLTLASILFGVSTDEAAELSNAQPDLVRAALDLAILESLPEAARLRVLAERKRSQEEEEKKAGGKEPRPTEPATA